MFCAVPVLRTNIKHWLFLLHHLIGTTLNYIGQGNKEKEEWKKGYTSLDLEMQLRSMLEIQNAQNMIFLKWYSSSARFWVFNIKEN